MALSATAKPWLKRVAQTGYVAKGIVYVLLGVLGFMAAFELGGKGNEQATQSGTLQAVKDLPGGTILLLLLALGLFCYSIWRGVQVFADPKNEKKKWHVRVRYLFSGLAYLALAYTAVRLALENRSSGGDQNQKLAGELLHQPLGQILVGLAALVFAGTGVYQIYYGLSEKYKKHVEDLSLQSNAAMLLRSGKIGYISRGLVWLVIAVLFVRAALTSRASEAGSTGKAFRFVEDSPYGSYLLAALALGLMAYGFFNFIRARYERFA